MRELRREPSLAPEPPDRALVPCDVRVQELERHLSSEREVADAVAFVAVEAVFANGARDVCRASA